MQELIAIKNTPALISVNFDELKEALAQDLAKYKGVLVTAETVSDAKKLATELNATKNEIGKRRKAEVARSSVPIKEFDAQLKELEAMCEAGRQELLSQTSVFEDETRKLASELLCDMRDELWKAQDVRPEFRRAEYESLATLGAVTGKGNLAAAVKAKLEASVVTDKQMQDQTDMRLLTLENKSYKSGLSAPLNRGHVEHFLFDDEPAYSSKLAVLMETELAREQVAQQRMRETLEREQRQKEEADERQSLADERFNRAAETDRTHEAEKANVEQAPMPEPVAESSAEPDDNGEVSVTVHCTFNVTVDSSVTDHTMKSELKKTLERAGIKTLASISIER